MGSFRQWSWKRQLWRLGVVVTANRTTGFREGLTGSRWGLGLSVYVDTDRRVDRLLGAHEDVEDDGSGGGIVEDRL